MRSHLLSMSFSLACLSFVGAQDPAGTPAAESNAAPPPLEQVERAIQEACDLLVRLQEDYEPDRPVGRLPDDELRAWQEREAKRLATLRAESAEPAEWPYEGVYRVRGRIPAGYRVGGSAIVCSALVEAPGYKKSRERQAAVRRGIDFMLAMIDEDPTLKPGPKSGYDVRGWGHTYALDFFLLALRKRVVDGELAVRIEEKVVPHLIECIVTNEVRGQGGWNYAGPTTSPFMTGSTLLALWRAREQGFKVDSGMIDRALDGLERARFDTGSYSYAGPARQRARARMGAMPGACARAAIAELCLMLGERSDAKQLRRAVDAFFEHWEELRRRKSQQGTHTGAYGIAPYYFLYGHTYAALAIEYLPEADRPALRRRMHEVLWRTRESDGSWNDRIFPRSAAYSTAMSVLALVAPDLDPIKP